MNCSIRIYKSIALAVCLLASGSMNALAASVAASSLFAADSPKTLLEQLYAAHQPWAHKDALENDATLPRWFDEELVRRILADRHCKAPDWGVGNLDFDPVLDAQDYGDHGIGDLRFRKLPGAGERWEASFLLFPGVSDRRTKIVYWMVKEKGVWKIGDIEYREGKVHTTLLHILAPKCE